MRQLLNGMRSEKSGQPFYGVEGAEERMQRLDMFWIPLQNQKLRLDIGQVFPRFRKEVLNEFGVGGKLVCQGL